MWPNLFRSGQPAVKKVDADDGSVAAPAKKAAAKKAPANPASKAGPKVTANKKVAAPKTGTSRGK